MKGLVDKISYAGLEFVKNNHDRKCILIINRMSIILTVMMFTFICFATVFRIYMLYYFTVPFLIAFALAPWFNSKGWLTFSKFFFCFSPVVCLLVVCIYNSIDLGDRYFFLTTATIPVLLFRKTWLVYLLFYMNVGAFIFANWYQSYHLPILIIPKEVEPVYYYFTLTSVFAVLFFVIRYFRGDSEVYEKELEEKNDLITEKNKEITDSIKYAKRIQQTLMPSEKYIEKILKNLKK
jgi:hypothetical protein